MKRAEQSASVSIAKKSSRRSIAEHLGEIDARTRRGWDEAISRRILRSDSFRAARVVAGYIALSDEANIDTVLAAAVLYGKTALVPAVCDDSLIFGRWRPCTVLRRSGLGVLEAAGGELRVNCAEPCLLLLPGRAFDSAGGRLGRGGGHYDRLLASPQPGVHPAGVGYEMQLVESVPLAEHDRRVEMVFTEQRCLDCG